MATQNSKISIEELQDLARFWTADGDALSLYFEPSTPSELAHREEPILAKQQIQRKLGSLQGNGAVDRADVQRVLETISAMKGNEGKSKIIFACGRKKLWREFDVPGDFGVRMEAGPAFALAPLIAQMQSRRRYCIALADRNRARLLLLEAREISEHSQVLDEEKEKIRTTGTRKSVHLERKKDEQVRQHFCFLADHLLHFHEHGDYDSLIIGCRDEMWPEIEDALHPELKRILAGRIPVDPGMATREDIQEKAQAIVDERDRQQEAQLVEKTVGAAAANGLGAVGIHAVIEALEKGEVRTLLWPNGQTTSERRASLCESCGHLEAEDLHACTLCGAKMRRFEHAEEALLRHVLGRSIEVRMLHYSKLPPPDQIAAWLRFRADQNTVQALAS